MMIGSHFLSSFCRSKVVLGGRGRIALHLKTHPSATLFYLQNDCVQGSKKPLAVILVLKKMSASTTELIHISLENWPSSGCFQPG